MVSGGEWLLHGIGPPPGGKGKVGASGDSSICRGRYREAWAAIEQALARKLEPPYSRYMLYGIAFLEGDTAVMQEQVDHVAGTPAEAGMLAMQSVTARSDSSMK